MACAKGFTDALHFQQESNSRHPSSQQATSKENRQPQRR
jgi:hypothetical protein